ncbi:MAG: 4Fe-4S dicluster domain-containing protein [Deltaproteobacteria bacterium]|nr:4Fe-4S dicluster domain-containing protein [Deltaproteobacteria bacterium]
MEREGWRLSDKEWREWVEALLRAGKLVIAPVKENDLLLFRHVLMADEISVSDQGKAQWSPKEFLFPRSEPLLIYRLRGAEVDLEEPKADEREQVLVGLRPCDAAGLSRLDDIFLLEEQDPSYAQRKKHTTIVSLACDRAEPECFCTAVGGSPAGTQGSDLLLLPLDDGWILRVLTPKGKELVAGWAARWRPALAEDWDRTEERRSAVENSIQLSPLSAQWGTALEKSFGHPLWESLGQRCLGCGICAYVCPSCSCFDINDEGNSFCGTRCRSWDSCAFARFTLHASGHNPRPTQPSRYRQRVLHKFAYFPDQHEGRFMCVGCGRCLRLCPVGIDIHHTVERAASAASPEEERP